MTRADQVKAALNHGTMDWNELLEEANEIADAYEQDYENGITWFEYADGSVAAFRGSDDSITVYGCKS
jgi:hypothetical protein